MLAWSSQKKNERIGQIFEDHTWPNDCKLKRLSSLTLKPEKGIKREDNKINQRGCRNQPKNENHNQSLGYTRIVFSFFSLFVCFFALSHYFFSFTFKYITNVVCVNVKAPLMENIVSYKLMSNSRIKRMSAFPSSSLSSSSLCCVLFAFMERCEKSKITIIAARNCSVLPTWLFSLCCWCCFCCTTVSYCSMCDRRIWKEFK